jgi:ATP-dependent Lon protease
MCMDDQNKNPALADPDKMTAETDTYSEISVLEGGAKDPEIQALVDKLKNATDVPGELRTKAERILISLNRTFGAEGYNTDYDQADRYIDWVVNLPWNKESEDNLDIDKARQILEETHYGLESIKTRILEYLAVLRSQKLAQDDPERAQVVKKAQEQGHMAQPVIFFVGLPGIGKTSISYTIARAMNKEFIRVPFGGMGSAMVLRGESRVVPEAEPGSIIKGLRRAGTRNPVILLDEIDRTAEQARAQIMGVLLELLDPEQNFAFSDYYIDYPFNLSRVMFIASANNTAGIANAALDRMELIKMPGYSDEEKIVIARDYILPKQLRLSGLPPDTINFAPDVWKSIARPFGYDAGIRMMERTVNAVVRKVALRMAEGRGVKFEITLDNVKDYMPNY